MVVIVVATDLAYGGVFARNDHHFNYSSGCYLCSSHGGCLQLFLFGSYSGVRVLKTVVI